MIQAWPPTADPSFNVHVFACMECPRVSSAFASGWKAYRIDDPERDEPTAARVLLS